MVQAPNTIVRHIGGTNAAINGKTTMKIIRRAFFNAGYGPNKIDKWVDLYIKEGILEYTGEQDEEGQRLYSSPWWIA